MPKVSDLRIVYKVLACFALFGIATAGIVWFAVSKISSVDTIYSNLIAGPARAETTFTRAYSSMTAFRMNTWNLLAEPKESGKKAVAEIRARGIKSFMQYMRTAEQQAPESASRIESARRKFESVLPQYAEFDKLALASKHEQAYALGETLLAPMAELQKEMNDILDEMRKRLNKASSDATASVVQAIFLIVITLGITMAVVFVIAFLMVQANIVRPITKLVPELNKLAEGDFNVTLPALGRKDEIGQIATAVETMVERMGTTIGNIKLSATEVTSASAEISSSTTDLSQRTEEQAASLEETSASMVEISDTVHKNAENARQANSFATETSAVAERGGAVVSEAVTAMAHIEESSQKISDIIGVIDEIARQTNLLALNAAVEAARAGEAGRGFAVVATEVRSLAQRSSQAAKDIKELITNSNSQVKNGVELVNKAGESLNEITASIQKVAAVVADIANASMEQSTGIEQINKALTQMDEATQQNSALVEENAATARTLETQAKSMDERVAMFRLRGAASAGHMTYVAEPSEPVAAPPPQKQAESRPAVRRAATSRVVAKSAVGGARGVQTALATAVNADTEWKDF